MLYRIHLWADWDRDRRVGGSMPNQNDGLFFCNTCNACTISHIWRRRIAAISAANRQDGGEDGCYCEKFRNFIAWAEPDPKRHFSRFRVPFDYPAHSLQETVLPQTEWYRWKAETLKVCLLLVWRVWDQAFGRYRPWMVPKSGHVTITKIENLHTATRRKIHWFQKCYSFRSKTKNNKVIVEKPFQNSGVTRRLWILGRLELMLVVNTSF